MPVKMDDKRLLVAIAELLNSTGDNARNSIRGIFIDETLSEFYQLESEIEIPGLPVKEIDLVNSHDIAAAVIQFIPEYMSSHRFLQKRKPASEQHSLHFILPVEGRVIDFVHIIRLDFRFTGKRARIIFRGDSERYPSYTSDMVYFKSQLVPVYKGSDPAEINSVRLKDSFTVETDKRPFTSVIFDEYSNREISIELSRRAGAEFFEIPVKIYPFINYEYFSACLSIPDPYYERIIGSARIFEPLFIYLYFNYRSSGNAISMDSAEVLSDSLELSGGGVNFKPEFMLDAKDFFSSYSLIADEDLMLKGWKRFDIK